MTIAQPRPSGGLRVFLSASVPSADERGRAAGPSSAAEVTAAAVAVARAVLFSGDVLVFGGHPSITPMVLLAAAEAGVSQRVVCYLSEEFADRLTPETRRLAAEDYGRLVMVDRGIDEADSLRRMRDQMMAEPLAAAVFVGGMDGIVAEEEAFSSWHPQRPRFLLTTPGGFAGRLAADAPVRLVPDEPWPPLSLAGPGPYAVIGRSYPALATRILDLARDLPPESETESKGLA